MPSHLGLLTRPECVNTALRRTRFDSTLERLSLPREYAVVDVATLPGTHVRRRYPTPTILVGGSDLFGLPRPSVGQAPT